MKCEYCGKKESVGYIDRNAACKKCIDKHIEDNDLHPITKRYLRYVNREN